MKEVIIILLICISFFFIFVMKKKKNEPQSKKTMFVFLLIIITTTFVVFFPKIKEKLNFRFKKSEIIVESSSPNLVVVKKVKNQQESYDLTVMGAVFLPSVPIMSQVEGKIEKSGLEKPITRVKKQDQIFKLKQDQHEVKKKQSDLQKQISQLKLDSKEDLFKHGLITENELKITDKEKDFAEEKLRGDSLFPEVTEFVSPFAGTVGISNIITGAFVKNDNRPLGIICNDERIFIDCYINIGELDSGFEKTFEKKVKIQIQDKVFSGEFYQIDNVVSNKVNSIKVRVLLKKTKDNTLFFKGQIAMVTFSKNEKQMACRIKDSAIISSGLSKAVFVIQDDVVMTKPVTVIKQNKDDFIVSGLLNDQYYVEQGHNHIVPGQKLENVSCLLDGQELTDMLFYNELLKAWDKKNQFNDEKKEENKEAGIEVLK